MENEEQDQNLSVEELAEKQLKEEKIETEKKELLNNIHRGELKDIKDRVAYILNNYTASRNSDIELAWNYWKVFENEKFSGDAITKTQLFKLSRISSLSRTRAKIQNEYKLFQANDEVKRYRGVLEQEKKDQALEDKPVDLPLFSVYIDESGKNSDFLVIGSLWILSEGFSSFDVSFQLNDWKKEREIEFEFHFAEVRRQKVQLYKDFFSKFLSLNPTVGFKAIMIKNSGFDDVGKAIVDLTFHLLEKGVIHEHDTGRAPLPRLIQVWLDEEEEGRDLLKLENVKERLKGQKIDQLYLGNFETLESSKNYFIQAVDLFTAAINRKLQNPNGDHFKDELADYILSSLDFDISNFDQTNSDIDRSTVFNLSHQTED